MQSLVLIYLVSECWIDKVISGIARLDYIVGPANKDFVISSSDSPVAVVSLHVHSNDNERTILNNIQKFLCTHKINYYSVVVIGVETCWSGSNISLSKIKEATKLKKNVPYLKLLKSEQEEDDGK